MKFNFRAVGFAFGAAIALMSAPAGAGVILGGSALLSSGDVTTLEGMLGEGPLTLTRLYSKAQDGASGAAFHANADGQGRTFSVVQVNTATPHSTRGSGTFSGPMIVGGYNPQSWDSHEHWHLTPDPVDWTAFLFNLTDNFKLAQRPTNTGGLYQTYNDPIHGPRFGGGHDLFIQSDMTNGYVRPFSYWQSANSSILGTTGLWYLTLGDVEVFRIALGEEDVPEPSVLAIFGLGLAGLGVARRRRSRK